MKNSTDKIVTPAQLRSVAKVLFDKSRFSGGELARYLKYDNNALWLDVHQRGLSAKKAKRIADKCYNWANELFTAGYKLEGLANKAKLTKKDYSLLKRKKSAKRN